MAIFPIFSKLLLVKIPRISQMISLGICFVLFCFLGFRQIFVKDFFPHNSLWEMERRGKRMMNHVERLKRDTAFTRKGRIPVYPGLQVIIHFISHVENAFPYLSTCLKSNCSFKQNIDLHLTYKILQF